MMYYNVSLISPQLKRKKKEFMKSHNNKSHNNSHIIVSVKQGGICL